MAEHNHAPQQNQGKSLNWGAILVLCTLGALVLYLFSSFMLNRIEAGKEDRRKAAEEETAQMQAQAEASAPAPVAAEATGSTETAAAAPVDGKTVFERTCGSCHQPTGLGIPGAFPPLAKSEYVNGDPKILTAIVLKGLTGEVKVDGQTFNGNMPTWEAVLKDAEIAAVLTYIRGAWGNSSEPVDEAFVAARRKELAKRDKPFTVKELKK